MKSVVELEIHLPLPEVAELLADPRNNPEWMHDVKYYEPVSGEPGMPGSIYRLVPKTGDRILLAIVVERSLPHKLRVDLEGSGSSISVTATMVSLSPTSTKLTSEEVFTFQDSENAVAPSVKDAIRAAHRRHMEDFKQFAEHH